MRIGIFSDTYAPEINGVVSSIITLQKELEKNGHEVYIITNHKALFSSQREGNVLRLPGLELKWLYGYKLSTPYHFSAKEEIKKMNLDVIHVHTEFGVGLFARIIGHHLQIPVVSTYHTMYEDYTHYINKFAIAEIDRVGKKVIGSLSKTIGDTAQAIIAPSEKTKEVLLKYGLRVPIYTIATGLNFDKFNADRISQEKIDQIRLEYGISKDDFVMIFVGRIAPEKSIDFPIEGFRYIKNKKIKLMIVGGGPQLEELKQLVKEYQLEEQVIFTDKKSSDEVPLYYNCANAFVSASLTETQGITFIEALACGLPVFARKDKVLDELVYEKETGYYFETPQEFADAVMKHYELSYEDKKKIQENAKQVVKKYDSNIFYNKVLSVYYQAIDDFKDAFEVLKIKVLEDYVKITVQNEKEDQEMKIFISMEDYFTQKIRKGMLLDRSTIEKFQQKEIQLHAYRGCIKKLRLKDYTSQEMTQYLYRNYDLNDEQVQELIQQLEHFGYLNDRLYMIHKIEKMQYKLQGKEKIIRSLVNKGFEVEEIKEVLPNSEDDEKSKAKVLAEKLKANIRGKSYFMKKQMIMKKLMSQGFESMIAKQVSEDLKFNEEEEDDALDKAIQKGIRNYSKKWKGEELKARVLKYCVGKGFQSSEVLEKLNEIEWKNE
ncbi:MAG: RecX family transcriptional regulator [Erysipelotrichaceae bacterium]|nr:RecX family transcriptional regulator [Erysipelotrichaceae bacterium]